THPDHASTHLNTPRWPSAGCLRVLPATTHALPVSTHPIHASTHGDHIQVHRSDHWGLIFAYPSHYDTPRRAFIFLTDYSGKFKIT
ncbi:MAG: hypothetical protein ACRCSS_14495, partial [Shewanella sp.]